MTRDEMTKKSHAFQKETGCCEQERRAFFDGYLEAHDLFNKTSEFSLADLIAVRQVFEERLNMLRGQRDHYRGRDIIKYDEKYLIFYNDPYCEKLKNVNKLIAELLEISNINFIFTS